MASSESLSDLVTEVIGDTESRLSAEKVSTINEDAKTFVPSEKRLHSDDESALKDDLAAFRSKCLICDRRAQFRAIDIAEGSAKWSVKATGLIVLDVFQFVPVYAIIDESNSMNIVRVAITHVDINFELCSESNNGEPNVIRWTDPGNSQIFSLFFFNSFVCSAVWDLTMYFQTASNALSANAFELPLPVVSNMRTVMGVLALAVSKGKKEELEKRITTDYITRIFSAYWLCKEYNDMELITLAVSAIFHILIGICNDTIFDLLMSDRFFLDTFIALDEMSQREPCDHKAFFDTHVQQYNMAPFSDNALCESSSLIFRCNYLQDVIFGMRISDELNEYLRSRISRLHLSIVQNISTKEVHFSELFEILKFSDDTTQIRHVFTFLAELVKTVKSLIANEHSSKINEILISNGVIESIVNGLKSDDLRIRQISSDLLTHFACEEPGSSMRYLACKESQTKKIFRSLVCSSITETDFGIRSALLMSIKMFISSDVENCQPLISEFFAKHIYYYLVPVRNYFLRMKAQQTNDDTTFSTETSSDFLLENACKEFSYPETHEEGAITASLDTLAFCVSAFPLLSRYVFLKFNLLSTFPYIISSSSSGVRLFVVKFFKAIVMTKDSSLILDLIEKNSLKPFADSLKKLNGRDNMNASIGFCAVNFALSEQMDTFLDHVTEQYLSVLASFPCCKHIVSQLKHRCEQKTCFTDSFLRIAMAPKITRDLNQIDEMALTQSIFDSFHEEKAKESSKRSYFDSFAQFEPIREQQEETKPSPEKKRKKQKFVF